MENATLIATVTADDLRALIANEIRAAITEALSSVRKNEPIPEGLEFDAVRQRLKLSSPSVRKLLRTGRLRGQQIGRKWVIDSASVDAFIAGNQP